MIALRSVPFPGALAGAVFPGESLGRSAVLTVSMSFVIAVCAQVSVPLPFTPVPLTGTTLAILYAGALLGARRGALAAALYLLEGGMGLPFFAGGAGGVLHFAGPTGGYLIGFVPAAYVTGLLSEKGWGSSPFRAFAMMMLGSAVIFAFGLAGLARFAPSGDLLAMGLVPFLPGDIAKSAVSAALLPLGWSALGCRKQRPRS